MSEDLTTCLRNCDAACCRAPRRVRPTMAEVARIRELRPGVRPLDEDGWLAQEDGRCVFLGETNLCGIYAHRPQTCRFFEVDGQACRQARGW